MGAERDQLARDQQALIEQLRESEERFRLLADVVPQIVWITDAEGRAEFFNKRWSDYTGRPYEPTTAAEVAANFVHPDDTALTMERFEQARRTGDTFLVEHRIRSKEGDYRWFLVRGEPYRDPGTGEITRWFGASVNIHDRKLAEDALRAGEERFRTLVENIRDYAIFMLDAEGVVTEWSEGARQVKGYTEEEVVGRHVSMFYAPEEVAAGDPEQELSQAAEEGRAEREGWRVRKGGERIWVNEIATAVRDDGGRLVGFTKISRDLTERRRAEEALRESEERYRLAADAAGLGRWEFIIETAELRGDAAFNEHHGAPPGSDLGFEGHLEAIHPEDHEAVRRNVARALEEGREYETEYRVPRPDGESRWILSRGRFVLGVGSASDRLVGVTLDVTERRELERERERSRTRELTARAEAAERERISRELHDRVAHSIAVAHQSLELHAALTEVAPERAAEKLELARETTRRALDQTRALSAELKRLQEEELAGGMETAFKGLVAESYVPDGIEVELSFSGDEASIPKPMEVQAYLAMREAIRNAVRHSGCSRIGITLEVREEEIYGRVEDDGEGFDPEAVGKATPSWGVGLRSMRERAEMLGGSLRVDSRAGVGTRVEVRMPLDGRA